MGALQDTKYAKLITLGMTQASIDDMEREWLESAIGAGPDYTTLTNDDCWHLWLTSKTVPAGQLNDRLAYYFGTTLSYTGTLNEQWLQFWENLT